MRALLAMLMLSWLSAGAAFADPPPADSPPADSPALAEAATATGYVPPAGFVPDAKTAVAIAEAILVPIYGVRHIAAQRPFVATLRDGVWIVSGRLPRGAVGGTAEVRLRKDDARVVLVRHGR